MYSGKILQCVQDKFQSLSTAEILDGKVRRTIPEKYLPTHNYRKNEQPLNVISQIRDKFGDANNINETFAEGFMKVRG